MERYLPARAGVVIALLLSLSPLRADAADTRRPLRATEVEGAAQAREAAELAHATRLEAIRQLRVILADSGDGPRAEMLLRLADRSYEEGHALYLEEMEIYTAAKDACFDRGCDPDSIRIEAYTVESTAWKRRSIKIYRQILAAYPQFERADEATFYLGQALIDTGEPDAANAELTRLVRAYPASRFLPDAFLLVGEHWFERDNATRALVAYQRAATFKDFDKRAFALYKMAWCQYNLGEPAVAGTTLVAVIEQSQGSVKLQDEALRDLVLFLADAGDLERARETLVRLGRQELMPELLGRLASIYVEQGKFEDAIVTWRRLVAERPAAADAPRFQHEIVRAYTKMGRREETLAEIGALRRTYGKQSPWARANATNADALRTASELLEEDLRAAALNNHGDLRKRDARAAGAAERAYEAYLEEFPDSVHSYEMRYSYAELLYAMKKHDLAYDQYMRVVAIDPRGARARFCAESAIFAAEEMARRAPAAGPGDPRTAIALTDWEQKQLVALDQYATLFDDAKTRSVVYKSAWLLYNRNHYKEASARFNRVIALDPKSREAEQAADLILDSFALVEDWESLRTNAKLYFDQPDLGSAAFKKGVFAVYENASLKRIETGKRDKAAEYLIFYAEFPGSANADLALHNAAVHLHDAGQIPASMRAREELLTKFPASKYYRDEVAALGWDYESIADFAQAAAWYERLYAVAPSHPAAADALYSAGLFRGSLGQWERAIVDYEAYAAAWPERANTTGVLLDIGRLYEDNGRKAEASAVYARFFTDPPAGATVDQQMFARLHHGLLSGEGATKHWKDSLQWYERAGRSAGSVEYAAHMMFLLAEPQYQAYLAMKVDGPGSRRLTRAQTDRLLGEQLVAKVRAMSELEKTYAAVVETGAADWGLGALARVGSAYENLGTTVIASWIPDYLTPEQEELYRERLEDIAWAQVEKATVAYVATLSRSHDLSVYNAHTATASRRLGVLRPEEYGGLFEQIPEPRFIAPGTYRGGI